MRSVKVHWVVGLKQKQWLAEEVFQNILHIQTYNWTKYALCECTLSGGLQAGAMAFRRNFSNSYTHSNTQLNKLCALWKYTESWVSSRSKGSRRNTSKHYTHSSIQLNKECGLWKHTEWWASSRSNGFQKKFFESFYTTKKNNWTKHALCESTVSGGLEAEEMAFRRNFSKHHTHSNIQLNKVCALWKYSESSASSRSNGFQKNFFKTLYTFKHTIEQNICSAKVHWVAGLKQKQWFSEFLFQNNRHIQTYKWMKYALCESTLNGGLQAEAMAFRRSFSKHYTHSNLQLIKVCALWKYSECWASSRSNGFQTKFFETLYTFKNTIEQTMLSVKVHWGVGFKQKQWLSEVVFWNIIHIQIYNWKKCAMCQSKLSGGLQAEAMAFRRSFSKQYTHSNIQLTEVCALWKYTEWWASSRSNGFQKKFFKTIYTFKHTVDWSMRSVKVHWVVGFKQKQWLSEEYFQNNIHVQTYSWTRYALSESTVSDGHQSEAMACGRSFSKHYTLSNLQLNKYALCESPVSGGLQAEAMVFRSNVFETLYSFKHTIE